MLAEVEQEHEHLSELIEIEQMVMSGVDINKNRVEDKAMLKVVQKFVDNKKVNQSEITRLLSIFVVTYSLPASELKKLTKKLDNPEFIHNLSQDLPLQREKDFISDEDLQTFEARIET